MTLDDHRHPCSERAPVACRRNHGSAGDFAFTSVQGREGRCFWTLFAHHTAQPRRDDAGVPCIVLARSSHFSRDPESVCGPRSHTNPRNVRLRRNAQVLLSRRLRFHATFRPRWRSDASNSVSIVDLAPVADVKNEDGQLVVVDLIENPVGAVTVAVYVADSHKLY